MLRRGLLLSLLLFSLAAPARAQEDAHKQVGQYVDLQPVGMPIVVDGQLVNYVFVYVRINLAAGADTSRWRAKEPFFRDALVRAGYATPFTVPANHDVIDTPKLTAAVLRDAGAITGPGVIRSVVVVKQVSSHRGLTPGA